jgi:prepilin-type N-terminal cleavage/methylation domain-containing protein
MTNKKGFTLMELLVVIAIISLLLSILLPTLSKVREQAKFVICATRQRSILTAINIWKAENGGNKLPPTTQGHYTSSGGIHWTIPNRLKYHYRQPDAMNGGSVIEVLGDYMENPEHFNCPLSGNKVDWQKEYLYKYNEDSVTALSCSYFLLWNWMALEDSGFNPSMSGGDSLMVMDFFIAAGPLSENAKTYGEPLLWMSSHPFRNANDNPFVTLAGLRQEVYLWMRSDPTFDIDNRPKIKLNSGYLDGHVEGLSVQSDYEAITRVPLYAYIFPIGQK